MAYHAFSCDGVLANFITALCIKRETKISFAIPVSANKLSSRITTTVYGIIVDISPPHVIRNWIIRDIFPNYSGSINTPSNLQRFSKKRSSPFTYRHNVLIVEIN